MSEAGFADIDEKRINDSNHPILCNLEDVGRLPQGFLEAESMIFEARKPD